MKNFLKVLLAVFCGFLVFVVLSVFALVGIVSSFSSTPEVSLNENTVVKLNLNGSLTERSVEDPFAYVKGMTNNDNTALGLDDVLEVIARASEEDDVKGLYLRCGAFSASPASLEEIRSAIQKFKERGKWVIAYGDNYTQGCYELASVADKVYMNPEGMAELKGFAMRTMMMKGLLDKLGVEMQVVKVGTYKSAVEPYILEHISDANRAQLKSMGSSLWNSYAANVSNARNVSIDSLNAYINKGLMWEETTKAVEFGLVDSLVYESAMEELLVAKLGCEDAKNMKVVGISDMLSMPDKRDYAKDKVAVVYAVGDIDGNSQSEEGINSKKLCKTLQEVAKEDNVKAIVLRVNSPGGSAFGSEQIWETIGKVRAVKPVIVSMGDYAASGGYYISCQGDAIVAEPSTLTGSIGIFGLIPNFKGVTDKLGINMDVEKTHELSDMANTVRPMSDSERNLMQNYVNRGYELFVKRCADGRGMTTDAIKAIAEGRVWTGTQAKEIGLVDELGTLDDAIALAAEKVGLEKYNVVRYPEKKDLITQIMEKMNGSKEIMLGGWSKENELVEGLKTLSEKPSIQARMPYYLDIE